MRQNIIGMFVLLLAFSVGVNCARACDAVVEGVYIYPYKASQNQIVRFGDYYCVFYIIDVGLQNKLGYTVIDGVTRSPTGVQWESPARYTFYLDAASLGNTVVVATKVYGEEYQIELHVGTWNGTGIEWDYVINTGIRDYDDVFTVALGPDDLVYLAYRVDDKVKVEASYIGEAWVNVEGFPKEYTVGDPERQPIVLPYGSSPTDAYVVYVRSVDNWNVAVSVVDLVNGTPQQVFYSVTDGDVAYDFHATWTGEKVAIVLIPYYDQGGEYGFILVEYDGTNYSSEYVSVGSSEYLDSAYIGKSCNNVLAQQGGDIYLANRTETGWVSSKIYEYGGCQWFSGYVDDDNVAFIIHYSNNACIVAVASEADPSGLYTIEVPPFVIISTNPFVPDHYCGIGGCYGVNELYFEIVGGGNVTVWAPGGFPGSICFIYPYSTVPFNAWAYLLQNPPVYDFDNSTVTFYNIPQGDVIFRIGFAIQGNSVPWDNNGGGGDESEENQGNSIPDLGEAVGSALGVLPEPLRAPAALALIGLPIILILLLITGGGATVKGAYNKGRRP